MDLQIRLPYSNTYYTPKVWLIEGIFLFKPFGLNRVEQTVYDLLMAGF